MRSPHAKPKPRMEIMKLSRYTLAQLQAERDDLMRQGWTPRGRVESCKSDMGLVYYQFMARPYKQESQL